MSIKRTCAILSSISLSYFCRHSGSDLNYANFIIYSTCGCRERKAEIMPARRTGKIVVACEEAKLPRYCFRAESRSFLVRICPKNSRYCFGASDWASFWKRGSFRSGSNIGSSRSSAGVSGMPTLMNHRLVSRVVFECRDSAVGLSCLCRHAGEELERTRTVERIFLDRDRGHGLLGESQRSGLVTETHIGQREITDKL